MKIIIHKDKKFLWKNGDLHTNFGFIKEKDIIKLINARRTDKEYFDALLLERFQKILEA